MRILVTGIGGQDGSYLAEQLLEQGHEVHGFVRRSSVENVARIRHLLDHVVLHRGDIADTSSIERSLTDIRPDQVYHLADQDVVGWSNDSPAYSADITYGGVSRILEGVRRICKSARTFIPCSATVFGNYLKSPCDESSPFAPASPYACAKAGAYHLAQHYRREHGMFVATGILYGHNSERQKCEYLLHRIARDAVLVAQGKLGGIIVTNPEFRIAIGYAPDFTDAMQKIINHDIPDDFVISGYSSWSVELLTMFALNHLSPYIVNRTRTVINDSKLNNSLMAGSIDKATNTLGWTPTVNTKRVLTKLVDHYKEELK